MEPVDHITTEGVDSVTQKKYIETSIDVVRSEVEEYFGHDGYWCECHAWNEVPNQNIQRQYNSVKSRRGVIKVACEYLRRAVVSHYHLLAVLV